MAVVLVGERDDDIRYLLRRMLTRAGYEVVAARDGPALLEAARSCRAAVVIVDCLMPDTGGYQACQALGADPRTAGSAILMLSARALPGDVPVALRAGANEVLFKPFATRELLGRVRALAEPGPVH